MKRESGNLPRRGFLSGLILSAAVFFAPAPVVAQVTAFKQAVAESASSDTDIAAFYQSNNYQPIWTGSGEADRSRRAELLRAIQGAAAHGLPVARYDPDALIATLKSVRTARDRGLAEVEMSRVFLQYARDIQTGVLIPKRIDSTIVRDIPYRDRTAYLTGLVDAKPASFFRALPPRSLEYNALLKEKIAMERLLTQGG